MLGSDVDDWMAAWLRVRFLEVRWWETTYFAGYIYMSNLC